MRLFQKAKRHLGQGLSGLHHNVKKLTGGANRAFNATRHFGNAFANKVENIPYVGKGIRSALEQEFAREREELGGRSAQDIFHGARKGIKQADRLANDPSVREAKRGLEIAQQQGLPVQGLNDRISQLEQLRIT